MSNSLLTENSAFFLSLATMIFAFATFSVRYCFYSKCSRIKIFGFECVRDIEREVEQREFEINHNVEMKGDEKETNV